MDKKKLSALKKEIESKIDEYHGINTWEALTGIEINEQEAPDIVHMIGIGYRGIFLIYLYKNYSWANYLIEKIKNEIKLDCSGKILLLQIERGTIK